MPSRRSPLYWPGGRVGPGTASSPDPQQVDAVQHGSGLMASDRVTPTAVPGRRHAKGVGLARGRGRFDGGGRVHAVAHPHRVARPRQSSNYTGPRHSRTVYLFLRTATGRAS